jgi:hypothetical protein
MDSGASLSITQNSSGAACLAIGGLVFLEKAYEQSSLQSRLRIRLSSMSVDAPPLPSAQLLLSGAHPRLVFHGHASSAPVTLHKPPNVRELHVHGRLTVNSLEIQSLCPAGSLATSVPTLPMRPIVHEDTAVDLKPVLTENASAVILQDYAGDPSQVRIYHKMGGDLEVIASRLVVNGQPCP